METTGILPGYTGCGYVGSGAVCQGDPMGSSGVNPTDDQPGPQPDP
ncbi:hypothetical protein IQ254_30545 [Nodosilinea sp. LEGE 07088]|nr:hypothetical protein [Nodosilinea sp. LEGE 07088]